MQKSNLSNVFVTEDILTEEEFYMFPEMDMEPFKKEYVELKVTDNKFLGYSQLANSIDMDAVINSLTASNKYVEDTVALHADPLEVEAVIDSLRACN